MVTEPWFKLYVGDYMRDTRPLSVAARGAYQEIRVQMWISKERGVITGDITELQVLLGFRNNEIEVLLGELFQKEVFIIEKLAHGKLKITDRSMVANAMKSAQKAAAGKKGMKKRYEAKKENENPVITDDITPVITNDITYMVSDTLVSNTELEKGGSGEKEKPPPELPAKKVTVKSGNEILTLEDCLTAFLESNVCGQVRDLVAAKLMLYGPTTLTERIAWLNNRMRGWARRFNERLVGELMQVRALNEWCSHFMNWLNIQDLKTNPNDGNNGQQGAGNKTGNITSGPGPKGGATLADLQALKHGGAADNPERTEFSHFTVVNGEGGA